MRFKEFLKEDHSNGTYISALVSDETRENLKNFSNGLKLNDMADPDQYHSTIIYSRKGVPKAEEYGFHIPVIGHFKKWEIFPTQTGKNCLIAIVDSPDLNKFHTDIRKTYGATHDFPEYHSHITISYDYDKEGVPSKKPSFDIVYDQIEMKPLDPDFVPKSKE